MVIVNYHLLFWLFLHHVHVLDELTWDFVKNVLGQKRAVTFILIKLYELHKISFRNLNFIAI